jgi:outer membrane protein assembly factor BamB
MDLHSTSCGGCCASGLPSSNVNAALCPSRPSRRHLAISAGALALATMGASAGDWPRWRGPELNGISAEKSWSTSWPASGPKQLWKAAVGTGFSSFAVSQGRVFTLGNVDGTDSVYALDAATGRELWKHSYACPLGPKYYEGGPGATPTVDGERVYTLSKRGHVFCFEASSGKALWQKDLEQELGVKVPEWGFASSPLIDGGSVILNVGSAGTALDKASGRVVWTSGKDAAGYATAVPFEHRGQRCVALFAGRELVAVKIATGTVVWRFPWKSGYDINAADPIVAGRQMFISSWDQGAALLDISGPAPEAVWRKKTMGNHFNSCVLWNGFLYGIDGNTDRPGIELRCVDLKTGEIRWAQAGIGLGSLMLADERLIVLGDKGELVIADASPEGFKPRARAQVLGGKCWTAPVLANGHIYCRNAKGDVVCVEVRD